MKAATIIGALLILALFLVAAYTWHRQGLI
jgi:phosphoglycerate-specific signal transduction histidine kinase